MKVLFASVILAAVGCYCQAPLPGMQQWQRQMQQHAVAERGLWQSQLDQVRMARARDQPDVIQTEEKLGQGEISDILTEEITRKDGLKEILKHLIRTKIKEANNERNENSALENLLKNSQIPIREVSLLELIESKESNESEEKPVSFLDKLSAIYVLTTETPEHSDAFEEIENEYEYEYDYQNLDSFELERSSLIDIFDDNDNIIEEHSERGLEAILGLDYLIESENSNLFDETFKGGKRPKIFLEEEFLTTEQDIAKNFLAEEIDSAQSETKELVDEMEKLLSILEVEAASDSALIEKSLSVIRSKLGSSSVQDLLGDTDFKNSVFYRFAIMRLPLREEDIPVAELAEVKKVIHNNIVTAAEETKELLKELKKDISEESNANDEARAHRLDDARRQLKKLLEIVSL